MNTFYPHFYFHCQLEQQLSFCFLKKRVYNEKHSKENDNGIYIIVFHCNACVLFLI